MHTEAFFAQSDVVCREIVKEYDVEFLSIELSVYNCCHAGMYNKKYGKIYLF